MFKKLEALLKDKKISEELANELDSEISTALKELRDEAATWRVKYNELNKNYEELSKSKEGFEKELSSLEEKIKKAKEEGKAELVKELEAEKTEKEELNKKLASLQESAKELKIQNAILENLKNYDVIDSEVVGEVLRLKVDIVDNELKFKKGDELVSLQDGIKSFFEQKPSLLKAQGQTGSGTNSGGSSFEGLKRSEMSPLQKAEFIAKNGEDAFWKLEN
jgi:chromosome segregation ATPase